MALPRLAVLCDFVEEGWPSMDLCADMLLAQWRAGGDYGVEAERVRPPYRRRFGRVPLLGRSGLFRNADRLYNRHCHYPRFLRARAAAYDLFHVVDHSYAQLALEAPAGRCGVFCHDLDTFRCLLDPAAEPRPRWFRAMVRQTLEGLGKAAVVFYTTEPIRRQILRHGLADDSKLVKTPLGVAPEFVPHPRNDRVKDKDKDKHKDRLTHKAPDDPADRLLRQQVGDAPFLLHVGSTIARKRIDVLLDVFAAARARFPGLRLVQNGGQWTPTQRQQLDRLGLGNAVVQWRGTSREVLAGLYRRAAAVLQPSEAEGFGLPVAEALACGAVVVASDIPVLREVGGEAALYCPVGDVGAWASAVGGALAEPALAPSRWERLARAAKFTWPAHAQGIADAYRELLTPSDRRAAAVR